ncbi:MAG: hypothetical protein KKE30_12795 [Gammaproteobacteria bacterium]|nr:hypothetical protein [Gammaproteobacteria bacterium]MBU1556450.1 hypothetical protein [Gammaproteobacteria bacterium]MBU2072204.1 hypothetical protein [Gammaproteobacteria bacterium]MBU2182066.1 hypothetical protein [Gammaproteobacteria bacterium]MBU2203909.1 hypothetical protein [Gammaproteobacteria bacterium]
MLLLVSVSSAVYAGETLTLAPGQTSPKASIGQLSWLAGHWRGEALGGVVEEQWAPPSAGSMVGTFKLSSKGKVKFYEIEIIREVADSLILQLKHFNHDLKGWEEKHQTVDFALVKIDANAAYFDGFTIRKISDNEIHMFVVLGREPEVKEVSFKYQRVPQG